MEEKLIEMIAEELNVPAEQIKPETNLKTDLNADSLDLFEMVVGLEEEYGIEIPTEDLEQLTTVQSVLDYLASKGIKG